MKNTNLTTTGQLRKIKTFRTHTANAQFNAELREQPIGAIARAIHTPYAFGPTHLVWDWHGTPVIIAETAHRRYEVYQVEGAYHGVDWEPSDEELRMWVASGRAGGHEE